METKRNNFPNGSQKKGGKDSTRVILTAAGATVVGAGGALAASELLNDEKVVENAALEAGHLKESVPEAEQHASETQIQHIEETQSQPVNSDQTNSQTVVDDSEIHPVDNDGVANTNDVQTVTSEPDIQQSSAELHSEETYDYDPALDDVDVDQIAQEITATEVDPNDVDLADVIMIDMVDTMYFEDGSEMPVALVHTPDGGQYMMVDIDNDLTFDVITDLEGNPVVAVDANLTMSDIEDMFDDTGDVLAYDPDQNDRELAWGGNPEDGIVDTSGGEGYLAMADTDYDTEQHNIEGIWDDDESDDDVPGDEDDLALGNSEDVDLFEDNFEG